MTDQQEVILVKQFRKAIERAIYEIPAGKLDAGEGHEACGVRELEEETGCRAREFRYLGFMYPTPALQTKSPTCIWPQGCMRAGCIRIRMNIWMWKKVPIEKVKEMIMQNEINDAKDDLRCFKRAIALLK